MRGAIMVLSPFDLQWGIDFDHFGFMHSGLELISFVEELFFLVEGI